MQQIHLFCVIFPRRVSPWRPSFSCVNYGSLPFANSSPSLINPQLLHLRRGHLRLVAADSVVVHVRRCRSLRGVGIRNLLFCVIYPKNETLGVLLAFPSRRRVRLYCRGRCYFVSVFSYSIQQMQRFACQQSCPKPKAYVRTLTRGRGSSPGAARCMYEPACQHRRRAPTSARRRFVVSASSWVP